MEEDRDVKAPVTRLRRRQSVEQSDDTKSPSAPSTPKKRGRLAAKPLLELIDENVPQNSPKNTPRKSISRDAAEEEKPLTSAPRSTRVKSNTSMISENTQGDEERPVTPARRSTRIKSNTSIILETAPVLNSPRAKRAAARRNSQIASDTETPVTPARTRGTRKDSTSSVDKPNTPVAETLTPGRTRRTRKGSTSSDTQGASTITTPTTPARTRRTRKGSTSSDAQGNGVPTGKQTSLFEEVISEEPETNLRKSLPKSVPEDINKEDTPSPSRKSPRLIGKHQRKSNGEGDCKIIEDKNKTEFSEKSKVNSQRLQETSSEKYNSDNQKTELSESSTNLLKALEFETPKNKLSNLNKSMSSLKGSKNITKRHRTKSWTNFHQQSPLLDRSFHSDNESIKKKLKKHEKLSNNQQTDSASGDTLSNSLHKSRKKSNTQSDFSNTSISEMTAKLIKLDSPFAKTDTIVASHDKNKENTVNSSIHNTSASEILFGNPPKDVKTTVVMEDSDSNSESNAKNEIPATYDVGDQCVPVAYQPVTQDTGNQEIESRTASEKNITLNNTCEPMDIDETVPDNVSLMDSLKENTEHDSKIPRKSSSRQSSFTIALQEPDSSINQNFNTLKRTTSESKTDNQDLDKSSNENKTTLVLSQIKDVSNTDNSISQSPNRSNDTSKSLNIPDIAKEGAASKNLTVTYLTSTPVQQKDNKKMGLQMNTSVITPNQTTKKANLSLERSKRDVSIVAKDSKSDSSQHESEYENSKEKNEFLDDEAQDAGDHYESGDSQDEDERRYEKDHEIIDKGQTLTSEDESSDDSDYEKDSFVVSSDEEDNSLLSGSGEDLNISDNELKMSAESKSKYNQRKNKEQNKASREMYEARHKLSKSPNTTKRKNKSRIDSTLLESEDDSKMPPKKNKRMRLESTSETSEPELDEVIGYKKKKSKRLSESVYGESALNEKEITIRDDTLTEKDDPLLPNVKQEPKTPQKELEISSVHLTDEIEKVHIDENISMLKANDTMDPLHTIVQQENEESDNSSISENEEIAISYDSMLNELNKTHKNKATKSQDISLNLPKQQKKAKDPIIDELNLTLTKKKANDTGKPNVKTVKRVFKKMTANVEESSESMDLNLLYSDDSQGTEKSNNEKKKKNTTETFIPLKKTEAKTDIRSTIDEINVHDIEEHPLFFIDSEGDANLSVDSHKVKCKNNSVSCFNNDNLPEHSDSDGAPTEVSYKNEKKKEKAKRFSEIIEEDENLLASLMKTPGSQKKKIKQSDFQNSDIFVTPKDLNTNTSQSKAPGSEKKKKKKKSESQSEDQYNKNIEGPSHQTPHSAKKKKLSESESYQEDGSIKKAAEEWANINLIQVPVSEKEKCNTSLTNEMNTLLIKTSGSEKKKKKILESQDVEKQLIKTAGSKKKKKISESQDLETPEENISLDEYNTSVERKKKKAQRDVSIIEDNTTQVHHENIVQSGSNSNEIGDKEKIFPKKRKRMSSDGLYEEIIEKKNTPKLDVSTTKKEKNENKKKKLKLFESEHTNEQSNVKINMQKRNKKRKEREEDECSKNSKIRKENSFDKIHVPRLPASILNQLDEKPKKENLSVKKTTFESTTPFVVEEMTKRKNKPSTFLEESVYLNTYDDVPLKKRKLKGKKPKVLPFLPTVCTSYSGFTTNFQVTVLPEIIEFVAQPKDLPNFKNDYLKDKRLKKLHTYDTYRKHRNAKLARY